MNLYSKRFPPVLSRATLLETFSLLNFFTEFSTFSLAYINPSVLDCPFAVTEERCDEVESLVFDLFANLGATGARNIWNGKTFHDSGYFCCDFHWFICLLDDQI